MLRKFLVLGTTVLFGVTTADAKRTKFEAWTPLTPQQQQLVTEAIGQEKLIIAQIRRSTPVVQSYIQNTMPDSSQQQLPVSDQYMMGRVDFGKAFVADEYAQHGQQHGWFRGSFHFLSALTSGFHMENSPTGFMAMMFVDPQSFSQENYEFQFVRREFLGTVRTDVFDVRPRVKGAGRFFGRIWVEDQQGNIVRFNGSYTNDPGDDVSHYFHCDSWRSNVQPGLWLPAAVYVEDSVKTIGHPARYFRAQTTYWGYSLKLPPSQSDAESMEIEGAEDESDHAQDVSPLEASRTWSAQAEQNVLDRLTEAGLVAPPSGFDKVLDQVTNNLIISNNLQLPNDIHCRVILTDPLEALAVGNTILLSKGMIDTLPNEASLAAVLSFELAHIVMGHKIDTRYAFNDRLLFPDDATLQRMAMGHSVNDDEEAARRGAALFRNSNYGGKVGDVGLFLEQVSALQKQYAALLLPRLGDPLLRADGQPWLASLAEGAPKLNPDDLTQIAALPLNSRVKINPWDDKVSMANLKPAALLSARDKMPLEVAPFYFRLQRYEEPTQAALPGNGAATPQAPQPASSGVDASPPSGAPAAASHP